MILNKLHPLDSYYKDRKYFEGKEFVKKKEHYEFVDDKCIIEAEKKYMNEFIFRLHENLWVKEK